MLESFERGIIWKLKPKHCPECNNTWIAEILWGYPSNVESIENELEQKEIVLGGCLITNNDPKWECNSCHHKWGEREE